jgi:hypothetical protein
MRFPEQPAVTICVLLYGDFANLAERVLSSVRRNCPRSAYRLVVGANVPGARTLTYVRRLKRDGDIDRLFVSATNLNKCPMMRRMFAGVKTEFIWWFDDDSYIRAPTALSRWVSRARRAKPSVAMWGRMAACAHPWDSTDPRDASVFVRSAAWYRGLPPPSWRPGGKGEFNFKGCGTGDGRWVFLTGGCWMIRTRAVRALDWPDRRLIIQGEDVILGEAIRQQGWQVADICPTDVAISSASSRGEHGELPTSGVRQEPLGGKGKANR